MPTKWPYRFFDGAYGTYYFQLTGDTAPCETANVSNPTMIYHIHEQYLKAGATALKSNTFGIHPALFPELEQRTALRRAGYDIALDAASRYNAVVFADIGPIEEDWESPEDVYLESVLDFIQFGARYFLFETMAELDPLMPAIHRIKQIVPDAVIAVSFAASQDGYTRKGLHYKALIQRCMEHPHVDIAGLNCVSGPAHMLDLFRALPAYPKPLLAMPNAGYPATINGRTIFQNNVSYFAQKLADLSALGISMLGGCCGTTPEHLKKAYEIIGGQPLHKAEAPSMPLPAAPPPLPVQKAFRPFHPKYIAIELDPPVNANFAPMLEGARRLKQAGADMFTVSDSPLARTRADSILTASILHRATSLPVLPHLSCRDKNYIAIKGLLLGACHENIHQILALTGDPIMQEVFARKSNVFNFNSFELISYIQSLNEDVFTESPFMIGGALNVNAPSFEQELRRAQTKVEKGATFFLSQPLFTEESMVNLRLAKQTLGCFVLAGILPIASYRNALFLNNEVSGITVPEEILSLLENASPEKVREISLSYSRQIMQQVSGFTDGYYLMTPLGKVDLICELLEHLHADPS